MADQVVEERAHLAGEVPAVRIDRIDGAIVRLAGVEQTHQPAGRNVSRTIGRRHSPMP